MTPLNVRTGELGEKCALAVLSGTLDAQAFEYLEDELSRALGGGAANLVADMSGVDHISSAGVGVFLNLQADLGDKGGRLVLAGPAPRVRDVVELLGLSGTLPVAASVDKAKSLLGL